MGYLDSAGLRHFTAWVKGRLSGKQDKLPGSFGQVVGFSSAGTPEAQYLTMGQVSDGNPVGTVISFLGLTAPAGYLVCDGTAHSISDYPALADFFRQQFGAANHFGGDGTSTFSVPDMRNLFLRGYRGEAEEQLSGEVGVLQPGTSIPYFMSGNAPAIQVGFVSQYGQVTPKNCDSTEGSGADGFHNLNKGGGTNIPVKFTTRPVNMAVLYCIKAVEADGGTAAAGDVYSTEEKRIGTWIDGKPLYRKVFHVERGELSDKVMTAKGIVIGTLDPAVCIVQSIRGTCKTTDKYTVPIPMSYVRSGVGKGNDLIVGPDGGISVFFSYDAHKNGEIDIFVEYTKTTD